MVTNAEVAAKLLRDAAGFFVSVGEQNPPIQEAMAANARTFESVATLVESDPEGECLLAAPAEDAAPDG